MSYATLIGFAVTCLVIELTPGPNMAYLAVLSIGAGRRAGFAAIIGIARAFSSLASAPRWA
jgi:threonine/homoserine/homoserine lactone efflux protein